MMRLSEFTIGEEFWCDGQQWRCTDIGTRTIVAIRIDLTQVGSDVADSRRTLDRAAAESEGWFNGPPYAVIEHVLDEDALPACSLVPESDTENGLELSERP